MIEVRADLEKFGLQRSQRGNANSDPVLQYCHMSNTLTIRLPEELLQQLRERARRSGLPMGQLVRQSLETTLAEHASAKSNQAWRKYVGIIKGGSPDVSSRKGFSRR